MKTKARKQEILERLAAEFATCSSVVICKFEGLTVQQSQELRGQLRASGGSYRVVANRLAHRAAKGTPFEEALAGQRGMTALAFPGEDVIGVLKKLVDYAKQEELFSLAAGVVEGRVLDAGQLGQLSKMPGREGLYAQLLFVINSSAQRLLGALNAPGREIAAVVQQAVEEKKLKD